MSSAQAEAGVFSFVLLPLGSRKLAIPAESVIELVAPVRTQKFPHCTPWLSGVLLRRGRVVPVCDVGRLLGEPPARSDCYHLIAEWQSSKARNWCAIPVMGECKLANVETVQPVQGSPVYIAGSFSFADAQIEILDLGKLIHEQELAYRAAAAEKQS